MGNVPSSATECSRDSIDFNQSASEAKPKASVCNAMEQHTDESPQANDKFKTRAFSFGDALNPEMQDLSADEVDDTDSSSEVSFQTPTFALHEAPSLKKSCLAANTPPIPKLDFSDIQRAAGTGKNEAETGTPAMLSSTTQSLPTLLNRCRVEIKDRSKLQIKGFFDNDENGNSHYLPQAPSQFHGQEFSDKYETQGVLGQNRFGVVLACRPRSFDSDTLEPTPRTGFIRARPTPRPEHVDMVRKEGLILQSLNHPHIHKCFDVIDEGARLHVVTETLGGSNLLDAVETYRRKNGEIPLNVATRLATQMVESIRYLHSECIVHRDVKEASYVCRHLHIDDPSVCLVLSDFGSATECAPETRLHDTCGTMLYMSPEIFKNNYGIRVDIWAMGVVLYHLVYGRFPFKDQIAIKYKQLNLNHEVEVTRECRVVLLQMLHKNETQRICADDLAQHSFFKAQDIEDGTSQGGSALLLERLL